MIMLPVDSSNIQSIGRDQETGEVHVKFHHGGLYKYKGVPAQEFHDMATAPSVGKFYAANIRKQYESEKICPTCYGPLEEGQKGNFCGGDACAADAGDFDFGEDSEG